MNGLLLEPLTCPNCEYILADWITKNNCTKCRACWYCIKHQEAP